MIFMKYLMTIILPYYERVLLDLRKEARVAFVLTLSEVEVEHY